MLIHDLLFELIISFNIENLLNKIINYDLHARMVAQ